MSPAGGPQPPHQDLVEHVTCLGCGCACDDITVRLSAGRIAEARQACALGVEWFGDGVVPTAIRVDGRDATIEDATRAIATLLDSASRPLIYLAPGLTCEAQRDVVALADLLRASLDTITSATVLTSIIAAQERGRAGATLGEIRNRADVLVFWGVDPNVRYPRYWSRYAPEPAGLQVTGGRRSRRVIAVDIGDARGPQDADLRVSVSPADEVATLTALDAIVRTPGISGTGDAWTRAGELAMHVTRGRYVVFVADAEPWSTAPAGQMSWDGQRAAALIAVTQGLNGPTRAALSTLRAGGNRNGIDSVLTAHTGYPTAVSFARGFPRYEPRSVSQGTDAVLIVGDVAGVLPDVMNTLGAAPVAVIGPRATTHAHARVAIDTGVAGIHIGGTAIRLDELPLPLRASTPGPRDPAEVIRAVITARSAR